MDNLVNPLVSRLVGPLAGPLRGSFGSGAGSVIPKIKALNPLVATDSALLNPANVGRPIPQRPVRDFNGTTQYATKAVSNYRSGDASGAIEVTFNTSSAANQFLFSTSDEATTEHFFGVGIFGGQVFIQHRETLSGNDQVATVDSYNDGLTHTARVTSNGSSYTIEVDGVAVATTILAGTNSGAWLSTMTELDNVVTGALSRPSTIVFFDGTISNVKVYDPSNTLVNQWDGYANTDAAWEDQIGTLDMTRVNTQDLYIPAINATTDALGNPLTNPATAGVHNGAETQYDFYNVATDGGTTPAILASGTMLTDYSFGDSLANPLFKREVSSVAEDRHTLFSEILTGACLEKANGFFSLNYITDQSGHIQFDEQGNPQQAI